MRHIFRLSILFFVSIFWASSSIALEEIVVTGERIDSPDLSHLHDMIRLMEQQAHFDLQESMRPENFVLDVDIEDDELEPCSDPVNGKTTIPLVVHISFFEAYFGGGLGSENSYREIAKSAQELVGGRASYEKAAGFVISLTALAPFNSGQHVTLSIMGDPNKSLYQNILEQYGFDPEEDELEKAACKAPTNV